MLFDRDNLGRNRCLSIALMAVALCLATSEVSARCGASSPEEIAETIARGHAYRKHVEGIGNGDSGREFDAGRVIARLAFPQPGIETPDQFAKHVRRVLNSTENQGLQRDRQKYWDRRSGTIVIVDPKSRDCGTAFRPSGGRSYYDRLQ